MDRVLINPAARLGRVNAIVGGRARRYQSRFAGPLSIKCVIEGVATWETASGRFEIGPAGWIVLNDDEAYTITVDSLRPVETFCVFFQRGFVEDAERSLTMSSSALLDAVPRARFRRTEKWRAWRRATIAAHEDRRTVQRDPSERRGGRRGAPR